MTHYSTQYLIGHGNFTRYLKRFGLSRHENCKWCGVTDTQEHVLYDCWRYTERRLLLIRRLTEIGGRLDIREIYRRKDAFDIFNEEMAILGKIRELE